MPRILKIAAIALAALLALLIVLVAIISATFNPNDYKPEVIKLVREKTQRTLSIPGDIKLTFFPRIGANLGKVSLSEQNNDKEFAAVDNASVSLALFPLLSKKVVVDKVAVGGLRANLVRFGDGHLNIDDLMSKQEDKGEKVKFAIDTIKISNASLSLDDRKEGRKLEISEVNMESGEIADKVKSHIDLSAKIKVNKPALDVAVTVKTKFLFDQEHAQVALEGLDASVKGAYAQYKSVEIKLSGNADLNSTKGEMAFDGLKVGANAKADNSATELKLEVPKLSVNEQGASGDKISGHLSLSEGTRAIGADFSLPSFKGTRAAVNLPALALDVTIKDAGMDAHAKLGATFDINLDQQRVTSKNINLTLDGKNGSADIGGKLSAALNADLRANKIDLANLVAAFTLPNPGGGVLKLDATGAVNADLAKKDVRATLKGKLDDSAFDIKLGMADFAAPRYDFAIEIDKIDVEHYQAKNVAAKPDAPEAVIDLSGLKSLHANGSVRIGALKTAGLQATSVAADLHAGANKIAVSPITAKLYNGSVNGALGIDFSSSASTPRITVTQNLTGIKLGPLLKDAIKKQPIDGSGDVQFDLATQGSTVSQMRKALSGSARLRLADGSISGINLAKVVRDAKAAVGMSPAATGTKTGTADASDKTDFTELSASFHIAAGVAHNDDLSAKTPLFRLGGAGDINVGAEQIDYLLKCTVVPTLEGQGGAEMTALKGLTVPVRLTGPLTAMGWRIDFQAMATEAVKQKAQDKVKDVLKGLFKR